MSKTPLQSRKIAGDIALVVLGGAAASLLALVVAALLNLPDALRSHAKTSPPQTSAASERPQPSGRISPNNSPAGQNQPSSLRNPPNFNPPATRNTPSTKAAHQTQALDADYDALTARFAAVQSSLNSRASDLGNQPMKPEIVAAIKTVQSDLAAARQGLLTGDIYTANVRLKRVREILKYLESL